MSRILFVVFAVVFGCYGQMATAADRPNILWITSEDHGPHMGCYGDAYATTPHVDALAKRGLRYLHCWSNAPVCAPARTTLITGLYAPASGGHHMRSMVSLPADMKLFPHYLREAGYYCTNNSKEDYNVQKPAGTWDESSGKAHWRQRAAQQPFFAVFNSTKSHESQIRTRPHRGQHDPAKVRVPAYHPDTKEVREDWAQYYDQVTAADADAGKVLAQLEADGLADKTIVFYFGDHGSGMPRNKRSVYNSGLHVPLVIHFPEKYKHLAPPEYEAGGVSDRLVSFVDFAPTVLSLAGVKPPDWMQGHAFAGEFNAGQQPYVYGFRDRMDERYDLVRSVRDERFVYLRNYLPHLPYGQHIGYMFQTPTTQVWKRLHAEGKLTKEQDRFWQSKPPEELYDLTKDPDEVHNLANDPQHQATLAKMRAAHQQQSLAIKDLGFLPESDMLARSEGSTPFAMARDPQRFPLERILAAAARATDGSEVRREHRADLDDPDAAVRYWGALGLLIRGDKAVASNLPKLRLLQKDDAPAVRIAAAETLARYGAKADFTPALNLLVELASPQKQGAVIPIAALNAIDALGTAAAPASDELAALPAKSQPPQGRYGEYAGRLLEKIRADLAR